MSWVCYFLKGRKFFNGNLLIVKYCDKQGSKYIYIVIKVKNFLFRFKLRCACGVFIAIFLVHNSKRPMVYKGIRYFARLQDFLKKSYSIFLKKKKFFFLPRIAEIMKKSVLINQYNVQNLTVPKLVQ